MPHLLTQLPASLTQQVSLRAHSSKQLCSDVVGTDEFRKPRAPAAPSPKRPSPLQAPASQTAVHLRPIDLLLTLGVAMLPPRHVRESLAPLHWALIRYGYLVATVNAAGDPFALNDLVDDYRYHNMTGLSEAVGVGCALAHAISWLLAQSPSGTLIDIPLDLEYLLGTAPIALPPAVASAGIRMAPHAKRRPDYLLIAEAGGRARLMLVECKGSSGAPEKSVKQLGSAMHQLAAIEFHPSGASQPRIDRHAYAARLSRTGGAIELCGVHPEDDAEPWIQLSDNWPEEPVAQADRNGHVVVHDPGGFAAVAIRGLHSRAAAWAGVDDTVPRGGIPAARRRSRFGELIGAASVIELPEGRRVEVFTGALVELLEVAGADPATDAEQRQAIRRRLGEIDERLVVSAAAPLEADDNPEHVASAITGSGVVLRIEVT